MKARSGFTLTELVAVVGIMLVLMGGAIGVLMSLAEQRGPDSVLIRIQAMMNAAREYASSHNTQARVRFVNTGDKEKGTTVELQYRNANGQGGWKDIQGVESWQLERGLLVCRDMPGSLPTVPSEASDPTDISDAKIREWEQYQDNLKKAVGDFFFTGYSSKVSGGDEVQPADLKSGQDEITVTFAPAGYRAVLTDAGEADNEASVALTIIAMAGGRISDFLFYAINANTGTRLVFD